MKYYLLLICIYFLWIPSLQAQRSDTIFVEKTKTIKVENDSLNTKKKHLPKTAALFSAILPGLGQFYNRKYWKIPIIYAAGLTCIYFATQNNGIYLDLRTSYNAKTNPNSGIPDPYPQFNVTTVQVNRDKFKRDREFMYILTFLIYGLQVVDATVDAHLKTFDLSDDLSLKLEPSIEQMYSFYPEQAVGMKLVLVIK